MPADRTVMVVDDDLELRAVIAEILAGEGYRALTAVDGADALAQLHAGAHPQLILLDLMMPGMDGVEFCARRKEDPEIAEIPLAVMSADSQFLASSRDAGAVAYLAKPVDLRVLLELVGKYVGTARPAES